MAQSKKLNKKPVKAHSKVSEVISPDEESKDMPLEGKKSVDIEAALEPAVIIDEKDSEDLPIATDDADETGDEVTLDDEELNPFGDKWEQ